MNRDARQLCLAAAFAIAAHAAVLAASARVWERTKLAVIVPTVDRSPTIAATPPVVAIKPPPPPETLGERDGQGEAISRVDAPETTKAPTPRDFEQAWTRQQPIPLPPPPSAVAEARQAQAAEPEKKREASSMGPMSVISTIGMKPATPAKPEASSPAAPPVRPEPETTSDGKAERPAESSTPPQPMAKASTPAPPAPAADPDPAEQGPSDLDAFAKEESVSFTRGGMEARGGREVKLKRPRVDLSFMADATRLTGDAFAVTMMIETDPTGHPSRVDVIDSSDSAIIDDAVRLAMYDSWFGGKMPDRFKFTVRFRRR